MGARLGLPAHTTTNKAQQHQAHTEEVCSVASDNTEPEKDTQTQQPPQTQHTQQTQPTQTQPTQPTQTQTHRPQQQTQQTHQPQTQISRDLISSESEYSSVCSSTENDVASQTAVLPTTPQNDTEDHTTNNSNTTTTTNTTNTTNANTSNATTTSTTTNATNSLTTTISTTSHEDDILELSVASRIAIHRNSSVGNAPTRTSDEKFVPTLTLSQDSQNATVTTNIQNNRECSTILDLEHAGIGDLTVLETPIDFQLLYRGEQSVVENVKNHRRNSLKMCVDQFNRNPKRGIQMLEEKNLLSLTHKNIAIFLYEMDGLSRKQVGEYLGKNNDVLKEYVNLFDFTSIHFDDALRVFLLGFQLPGEAQIIDRIMEKFSNRYVFCNPDAPLKPSTAYILAFSIIMLNTDLHSPNVKNKMTLSQFLRNCKAVGLEDSGENFGGKKEAELGEGFLSGIFGRILENELKFNSSQENMTVFCSPQKQGWLLKEGGRIKTHKKRWFILKDACLYYFKTPEEESPIGIIPLVPELSVRIIHSSHTNRHAFEIFCKEKQVFHHNHFPSFLSSSSESNNNSSSNNNNNNNNTITTTTTMGTKSESGGVRSNKRKADGRVVVGQHSSFVLGAENQTELLSWVGKIEAALLLQSNRLKLSRKITRALSSSNYSSANNSDVLGGGGGELSSAQSFSVAWAEETGDVPL